MSVKSLEELNRMNWSEIRIEGLTARDGSEYVMRVSKPTIKDGTFACRVLVPGIVDRLIYHESALSAFAASISLVEKLVHEPSELLLAETTLTMEDFPDLEISVSM